MAKQKPIRVVVEWNALPAFESELDDAVGKAVRETAFDVEADAKMNIRSAPNFAGAGVGAVDTGSFLNSMYTSTRGGQEGGTPYSDARSAAQSANPDVEIVGESRPPNDLTAVVGSCVEHGSYVENGTSRMPARPTLVPALEANGRNLVDKVTRATNDAARSASRRGRASGGSSAGKVLGG